MSHSFDTVVHCTISGEFEDAGQSLPYVLTSLNVTYVIVPNHAILLNDNDTLSRTRLVTKNEKNELIITANCKPRSDIPLRSY